jgi:hypothetical protein
MTSASFGGDRERSGRRLDGPVTGRLDEIAPQARAG